MSLESDVEESIVEYARFHGLAIDHLTNFLPHSYVESLRQTFENTSLDDSHLKQIEYRPVLKTDERLTVDEGAAILMDGASGGLQDQKHIKKICATAPIASTQQQLKLEPPLLRSDPDEDFAAFKQRQNPSIEDGSFIYEPLDGERDEGLQWPSGFATLPKNIIKDCATERIGMLRDTLIYMQASLKDNWTKEDTKALLHRQSFYKRNTALDPVTPPLSPHCWPTTEPFMPSSPNFYLPVLSDPASLLIADLEAAEEVIFEDDEILPIKEEDRSCSSPFEDQLGQYHNQRDACFETEYSTSDELFPVYEHQNASDLKVEVPLTPPLPLTKTVTFSDTVEEMLFDHPCPDFATSASESGNAEIAFMERGLFDTFREAYKIGSSKIEEEQLQEAATTRKVKVPVMDFTTPNTPWKASKLNDLNNNQVQLQEIVKSILKETDLPNSPIGLRKMDKSVGWTVFPSGLAKVALIEDYESENVFHDWIISTTKIDVISSADVTYKTPGIRMLRETDEMDDEDLEPGLHLHQQPGNMTLLLRKRKLQLEELGESGMQNYLQDSKVPTTYAPVNLPFRKPTPVIVANSVTTKELLDNGDNEMNLIGGLFSAATAVDNFMELRGTKKHKLTDSDYFARSIIHHTDPAPESIGHPIIASHAAEVVIPLPLSNIVVPTTPTPFIIATELLKQRPLVNAIKALFPAAHFIERDLKKFNTTAWLRQGSTARSPIISSLAAEADLILSPSTGVVLTTLMKIKQKPLPGQKEKSEIKGKIEAVSRRYERLLVFISEASLDGTSTTTLGGQDCVALAEFMGFCASLPSSVNVFIVPAGRETLSNWIVAAMIQYCSSESISPGLLEEETQWELFLRRCGMNTYGAQAVVSNLSAGVANQVSPSKYGIFGISSFVEMDHTERVRRLRSILDGESVLNRVSQVVDARWRCDTP